MKYLKNLKTLLTLIIILYSKISTAQEELQQKKEYKIPLSVSIDLYKSQDAFTDLSLGVTESFRILDDYAESINILNYVNRILLRPIITMQIGLWTHEICGHSIRASQFGVKTIGFSISGLGAATYLQCDHPIALQELSTFVLGGNEAAHDLAEKIKNRTLETKINPFYGCSYIFSQSQQISYIYFDNTKKEGHDINIYIDTMQRIYGENYITKTKIKSIAFLDFLDPFFYYSLYAQLFNETFSVPMISIGSVKFLPAARLHLTPYGIEKQGLIHFIIEDILIKITASFGKTRQLIISEQEFDKKLEDLDLKNKNNKPTYRNFDDITKEVNTFGLLIESPKFITINEFSLGASLGIWNQPDIFRKDITDPFKIPLLTEMKIGGIGLITCSHTISEIIDASIDLGYKTNGYIHGYPTSNGVVLKITAIFKI